MLVFYTELWFDMGFNYNDRKSIIQQRVNDNEDDFLHRIETSSRLQSTEHSVDQDQE